MAHFFVLDLRLDQLGDQPIHLRFLQRRLPSRLLAADVQTLHKDAASVRARRGRAPLPPFRAQLRAPEAGPARHLTQSPSMRVRQRVRILGGNGLLKSLRLRQLGETRAAVGTPS
jgi:hypothetical protein